MIVSAHSVRSYKFLSIGLGGSILFLIPSIPAIIIAGNAKHGLQLGSGVRNSSLLAFSLVEYIGIRTQAHVDLGLAGGGNLILLASVCNLIAAQTISVRRTKNTAPHSHRFVPQENNFAQRVSNSHATNQAFVDAFLFTIYPTRGTAQTHAFFRCPNVKRIA
jgi:hypothetical protein